MAKSPDMQRWWNICMPLQAPLETAAGEWWATWSRSSTRRERRLRASAGPSKFRRPLPTSPAGVKVPAVAGSCGRTK